MIDSSGRRGLRANGTIFDLMPIGQVIGLIGGLLVALFVIVKPEASHGLGFVGRTAFWILHVGLGLLALWVASRWLASGRWLPDGTLMAVLVSGIAGVAVAGPGYLTLDTLFASSVIDTDPEPPAGSVPVELLREMAELAPWFLLSWLLINLPVLLPRPDRQPTLDDSVAHDTSVDATQRDRPDGKEPAQRFLLSLPGVVGTDVIAVASDLHYLNVWTVAGRTTVLGSLREVVVDLGDIGMQVHRSHWVAHAHVRRIVGTAGDAACILSNELRVPISRRRWKAVREQFGRGVVHTTRITHEQQADQNGTVISDERK